MDNANTITLTTASNSQVPLVKPGHCQTLPGKDYQEKLTQLIIRSLRKEGKAKEELYRLYKEDQSKLQRTLLFILTDAHVPYEAHFILRQGAREEPGRISISDSRVRVRLDNYLPQHSSEAGELLTILFEDQHPHIEVHQPALETEFTYRPIRVNLEQAHRSRCKATFSQADLVASDSWALASFIILYPGNTYDQKTVFVNCEEVQTHLISQEARNYIQRWLQSQNLEASLIEDGSDYQPRTRLEIQTAISNPSKT